MSTSPFTTFTPEILGVRHVADLKGLHTPIHPGVVIGTGSGNATISCILRKDGRPYLVCSEHLADAAGGIARVGTTLTTATGLAVARVASVRTPVSGAPFYDAVLANILVPYSFDIPHIGIPRGHRDPADGMKVKGVGINSGFVSNGTILNQNFGFTKAGPGSFQDLPVVSNTFIHSLPMGPGDSGGPILTTDNYIVGFHTGTRGSGGSLTRLGYKASSLIKGYGGNISFAGRAGTFTPSGSFLGTDNPLSALIQAIIAFITNLLAIRG